MSDEDEGSEEFDVMCAPPTPLLRRVTTTNLFTFSASNFITKHEGVISDKYHVGEKIGAGGYGEVFSCRHKDSGIERAVKVLEKSKYCDEANENVENEFEILKELDHPNILRQIEMFQDDSHYYIVTEICRGGELFDEIEQWGNFIEEDAAELMRRVLAAINYCHKRNVAHRDLKPENILLEENKALDSIKIIDFGLSIIVENNAELTDLVGSSYYVAPEVLKGSHTKMCDVYSCGVILYILLSGFPPFDGHSDSAIKEEVLKGEYDFEDEIWDDVSEEAKDFIRTLLTYEPSERPTAEEALQHRWIVNSRLVYEERLKKRESVNERAMDALFNLERFHAQSKLKQATCAFIASQLVLKEEKEKIDELFRALDINSNGKLTKEDVKTGYFKLFGKKLEDKMVDEMFKRVDYDNTGFIEYSEFVIASMNEKEMLNSDRLRVAFSIFDSKGSGTIQADDLIEVLSYFDAVDESLDSNVIHRIIKQVDENGDGEIDFEEFTAMMFQTAEKAVEEESAHNRIISEASERSESHTSGTDFHEELAIAPPSPQKNIYRPSMKRESGTMGTKACLALFERNIQKNKERGHEPGFHFCGPTRLSFTTKFSQDRRRRSKEIPATENKTIDVEASEPAISRNSEHSPKSTRQRAALFEQMGRKGQGDGKEAVS